MKAKKWIGMALSAVMLIGTLAGCASDTTSTNNNAAANKNKAEVQESQDDSVQTNDVETGNGKSLWHIILQPEAQKLWQKPLQKRQGRICLRSLQKIHIPMMI